MIKLDWDSARKINLGLIFQKSFRTVVSSNGTNLEYTIKSEIETWLEEHGVEYRITRGDEEKRYKLALIFRNTDDEMFFKLNWL